MPPEDFLLLLIKEAQLNGRMRDLKIVLMSATLKAIIIIIIIIIITHYYYYYYYYFYCYYHYYYYYVVILLFVSVLVLLFLFIIKAEDFANYFSKVNGSSALKPVHIPGRMFPVQDAAPRSRSVPFSIGHIMFILYVVISSYDARVSFSAHPRPHVPRAGPLL